MHNLKILNVTLSTFKIMELILDDDGRVSQLDAVK